QRGWGGCADSASISLAWHAQKFEFNPKDGIDNPALTLTEDTAGHCWGSLQGPPRFYLLSKGSTETFGFCLNEELGCRGHVIRQVEVGGLAQRRGLQDGDRLLQVNGHFVDHMEHHRVSWEYPRDARVLPGQGHRGCRTSLLPGALIPHAVVGGGALPRVHSLGLSRWCRRSNPAGIRSY
uniref:PDZ domain-containing protein n=1 Tax=Falco tinnunculus TaxID=100819 RepID=A0A8C4UDX6_FALTI